ncbi:MAG TPA: hypothetical protein PLT31_05505, partial [Fibrobacteraceae bacterium]|nr:hypothetical protein [Fibrobacteraceae bacterium]
MNFKIILCLAITLIFIACDENSPTNSKPEQENSSSSEIPMMSSSSEVIFSSSSVSCVESVDDVQANIYTTNIENFNISRGVENEGLRIFDKDQSILMT